MSERSLTIRRRIHATPERLFEAWTDASQLQRWWGPPGVRCSHAELDARVGGRYRIDNEMPDGRVISFAGEFLDVVYAERLVFTWGVVPAPEHERVTVTFEPADSHTDVVVHHERIPDDERARSHEAGWVGCLDGLADHV